MPLKILGHARDLRSNTPVIYCQVSIPEYLAIVGDDFGNFTIQRRRESHKAYDRLSGHLHQPYDLSDLRRQWGWTGTLDGGLSAILAGALGKLLVFRG